MSGKEKKIVIFGAGKIGRSFIGQLFGTNDYRVVFVDVAQAVIDEINQKGSYKVVIKDDEEKVIEVKNVSAVHASNSETAANDLATADIAAISVGAGALKHIAPLVAKGLLIRQQKNENRPLDFILAENVRDASVVFHQLLQNHLPLSFPISELVGLVETSIGKMVPLQKDADAQNDLLTVYAEAYNTLILDKRAFKNPIPKFSGISAKNNIKAWVDRKLFIHNLGHSAAAYLASVYFPDAVFLYEPLADDDFRARIKTTMREAADILLKVYPNEFTPEMLAEHIDDLIRRFRNVHLGDTIFRVGCDLYRKLGKNDRLAGAIHLALHHQLPYSNILFAWVCGCYFNAADEKGNSLPGDVKLVELAKIDINKILKDVGGFDPLQQTEIFVQAEEIKIINKLKPIK